MVRTHAAFAWSSGVVVLIVLSVLSCIGVVSGVDLLRADFAAAFEGSYQSRVGMQAAYIINIMI